MAKKNTDFVLKTVDDIFSSQEERDNADVPKVKNISISLIDEFPNHPFKVRSDEEMEKLIDSINNQSEKIVVETVVPETTENVTLPIDKNADEWNGLMPTGPSSEAMQDEIEFVGYDELTVSSDNRDIELVNPYGNTVYFRYSVYVNDDLIHTTDLIPPGEAVKYNIYSKLNEQGFSSDDEKISLVFFIKTYDIYSQSACTPCSVKTKISIS